MAVLVCKILKYLQTKVGSSDLANKPQNSTGVVSGIAAPPDHVALVHSVEQVFGWTYIIVIRVGFGVVTMLIIRRSAFVGGSQAAFTTKGVEGNPGASYFLPAPDAPIDKARLAWCHVSFTNRIC